MNIMKQAVSIDLTGCDTRLGVSIFFRKSEGVGGEKIRILEAKTGLNTHNFTRLLQF